LFALPLRYLSAWARNPSDQQQSHPNKESSV